MSDINKIVQFSDLHIGNRNITEEDIIELLQKIVMLVDQNTLIVFTGDLFHKKVALDSEQARIAMKLFITLDNIGCPSIFILGTRSHDYDYMNTFDTNVFENITFVKTVSELQVNNLTLLAVPEEYVDDQNDYYKDTIYNTDGKIYDIVLFHGTISDVASYNQHIEAVPFKKAPTFSKADFWKISNIILCGHIHKEQEYVSDNGAYLNYCGSWGRMEHGSEEEKVLKCITLSTDNALTSVVNHPNLSSTKFKEFQLNFIEANSTLDIVSAYSEELIKSININDVTGVAELAELIETYTNSNVYVKLKMMSLMPEAVNQQLKSLVDTNYRVSLQWFKDKAKVLTVKKEETISKISELESLESLPAKINYFVKDKTGIELGVKPIEDFLNSLEG